MRFVAEIKATADQLRVEALLGGKVSVPLGGIVVGSIFGDVGLGLVGADDVGLALVGADDVGL